MNYESVVEGKEGIVARVVQASRNAVTGVTLWSLEIEDPRFILAEINTHSMLEKNSASSRAQPVNAVNSQLLDNPAMPVWWGKKQSGMQAYEEVDDLTKEAAKAVWIEWSKTSASYAKVLDDMGLHKQITNRGTEAWHRTKTVISGTEWNNFFHLRTHHSTQPEFRELALCMKKAMESVTPRSIKNGEWHVPYVDRVFSEDGVRYFSDGQELSVEDALMVSASCCAQVSYRKSDTSLAKARSVFERLNIGHESEPAHASPCTHQGTPMQAGIAQYIPFLWPKGVTHVDRNGNLWSGKFKSFIQYRKLIPNEAVEG